MPKPSSQPAQASSNTVAVQQDWRDRDFVQGVAHGVAQLTTFLNDFGESRLKRADSVFFPSSFTRHFCFLVYFTCTDWVLYSSCVAEATTRGKLSSLNGKLSKLERRMQMVEATLQSVDQQR